MTDRFGHICIQNGFHEAIEEYPHPIFHRSSIYTICNKTIYNVFMHCIWDKDLLMKKIEVRWTNF